ncbi:MAG: hypothetical protein BWZ02_01197 [Lentisphaerae bacterium ADurb.BinA184]|nr:MAG: hypothetical protein BWZ02_01197 [Lentisphaerae bacterium ADurb.BinA184]
MKNGTRQPGRLTRSRKVLLAVAVVMLLLVGLRFARPLVARLPLPATLHARREALEQQQKRLAKLERRRERRDLSLAALRREMEPLIWKARGKVLASEVQNKLEQAARNAHITIRTMGTPRVRDVSEHLRGVEVSINVKGTMREIGRFLAEVEAAQPRFTWVNCNIRSAGPREVDTVTLSGRIEALFLSPESERLLFEQGGGT